MSTQDDIFTEKDTKKCELMSFWKDTVEAKSATSSPKNVWAYWETGFSSMRPWLKSNVMAWKDVLGPDWTVRVLDRVKYSAYNIENFLDMSRFPPAFRDGRMDGKYSAQCSSDFVRLACLYEYGGVWMDVSIILLQHVDTFCWSTLSDPSNIYDIAVFSPDFLNGLAVNWFIAANRRSRVTTSWLKTFFEAWGYRTNCSGMATSVVLQSAEKTRCWISTWDEFSGQAMIDLKDYLGSYQAWEASVRDCESSGRYPLNRTKYETILFLDLWSGVAHSTLTQGDVSKQFSLLTMCVDSTTPNSCLEEGSAFADSLLDRAPLLKFAHFSGGSAFITLASLLDALDDQQQNCKRNAKSKPYTFMDVLRLGAANGKTSINGQQ